MNDAQWVYVSKFGKLIATTILGGGMGLSLGYPLQGAAIGLLGGLCAMDWQGKINHRFQSLEKRQAETFSLLEQMIDIIHLQAETAAKNDSVTQAVSRNTHSEPHVTSNQTATQPKSNIENTVSKQNTCNRKPSQEPHPFHNHTPKGQFQKITEKESFLNENNITSLERLNAKLDNAPYTPQREPQISASKRSPKVDSTAQTTNGPAMVAKFPRSTPKNTPQTSPLTPMISPIFHHQDEQTKLYLVSDPEAMLENRSAHEIRVYNQHKLSRIRTLAEHFQKLNLTVQIILQFDLNSLSEPIFFQNLIDCLHDLPNNAQMTVGVDFNTLSSNIDYLELINDLQAQGIGVALLNGENAMQSPALLQQIKADYLVAEPLYLQERLQDHHITQRQFKAFLAVESLSLVAFSTKNAAHFKIGLNLGASYFCIDSARQSAIIKSKSLAS